MRRITPFISSGTTRALLVSVLILAGGTFSPAWSEGVSSGFVPDHVGDETAFAQARQPLEGDGAVALPRPLSSAMVSRYRLIFQAQRRGDLQAALEQTRLLKDPVLMPDVLAERYLSPGAHPSPDQLRDWLKTYSNQPDASALHDLLVRSGGAIPAQTFVHSLAPGDQGIETGHSVDPGDPVARAFIRNPLLDHTVQQRSMQGTKGAISAFHLVDATPGMTAPYAAHLYGEIALSLLSQGEVRLALRHAVVGFARGDRQVSLPAYVAGLAAWREGQVETAYDLFEAAANAPVASAEIHAASAFWAARVQGHRHRMTGYVSWLNRAANLHETFYGMLAVQTLEAGRAGHARWPGGSEDVTLREPVPVLGEIDVEAVQAMAQGRQLFALLQVGERGRAEALMRRMWPDVASDSARSRSLQLVAQAAGFEDLSEQMASLIGGGVGAPVAATQAALPLPRLRPAHGFRMNPALVYALARVESNFDAGATSGAGAHGLMQIRPTTASFVTSHHQTYDSHGVAVISVPPDMVSRLHNPSSNLEIGQLYVLYLATQSCRTEVPEAQPDGGDLVRVLASYNAGPGAIARWEGSQSAESHDPLFFIETLPNTETRNYVHRALNYSWLYAQKMGLSSPSLQALTRSEWPSFGAEEAMAHERVVLN